MCGVFGILNERRPAGPDIFVGCKQLQHRGKESGGIATYDAANNVIDRRIGMGEMPLVFASRKADTLRGRVGVGQVRYSNTGSSSIHNAQPMFGRYDCEEFALCFNGQIVNMKELLDGFGEDYRDGVNLQGDYCDTRLVVDLISTSQAPSFIDALVDVLRKLKGAFCFVILYKGEIYAARDPYGVHPLQIAKRGNDYMVASESCAFDHLKIKSGGRIQKPQFMKDIDPGEMVVIGESGPRSQMWTIPREFKFDIFEIKYFLRPDSKVHGVKVARARRRNGYYLAEEHPTSGLIVPVKSSGEHDAWGYYLHLREMGYDVEWEPDALLRPNTSGRIWVEPYEEVREEYLREKFNAIEEFIRGQDITLVDDSIVRGTTITHIIALCREAGARSVHVRSGSDLYLWPDIYGNDTYKDYVKGTLIARRFGGDVARIAKEIGADSLGYLSLEKMKQAILDVAEPGSPFTMDSFHDAVFTGTYALGKGDFDIK
ncbi:MAG: amidophosphoribosyltransferase [Candidatus Spechtbacteria bacterium]|nr:amidophosphoribosyltransferase [Candidatus Spechtbacteria bacterium]